MNEDNVIMDDFYQELVRRFFNKDSYFYHSINQEIEHLKQDNGTISSENSLLLGSLFDKLVESEDPVILLNDIHEINGFHGFVQALAEEVDLLKTEDYDQERMKIQIQLLAQSLIRQALHALDDEPTKLTFKNLFNIEETAGDKIEYSNLLSPTEITVEDPDGSVLEESLQLNDELFVSGELERTTLFDSQKELDEIFGSEPEINSVLETEPEQQYAKKSDGQIEFDVSEPELLSNNVRSEADAIQPADIHENGAEDKVNGKPESVLPVFKQNILVEVEKLRDCIEEIRARTEEETAWDKCQEIFETIAISSMIYGIEAFEQIAAKANLFIQKYKNDFVEEPAFLIALMESTFRLLQSLLQTNIEKIDSKTIVDFSKKLTHPDEYFAKYTEQNSHAQQTPKRESDSGEVDRVDHSIELNPANITIPGEDDEEIINLLSEISQEKQNNSTAASPNDKLMDLENDAPLVMEINETEIERGRAEFDIGEVFSLTSPISQESRNDFWTRAELYLNIVDDALIQFSEKHDPFFLYDDLELACESLKNLALKLDVEPLGEFPALILEILKKSVKNKIDFSEVDLKLIENSFAAYKASGNGDNKKSFNELTNSLQELYDKIN